MPGKSDRSKDLREENAHSSIEARAKIKSSIDDALDCYGGSVKEVIYWNFEKMFGASRDSIPDYPEKFVMVLEKIFGGGSLVVQKTIIAKISLLVSGEEDLESSGNLANVITKCTKRLSMNR